MIKQEVINSHDRASMRYARRGAGTLEMLVSFALLMTAMSIATPMVVRYFRLTKSQVNYRLALDELTNQMDRLTVLPQAELVEAIRQLAPSGFVRERLANVTLSGELQPMESGTHIMLRIWWDEVDRARAPVKLSGWVFDPSADPERQANEGGTP